MSSNAARCSRTSPWRARTPMVIAWRAKLGLPPALGKPFGQRAELLTGHRLTETRACLRHQFGIVEVGGRLDYRPRPARRIFALEYPRPYEDGLCSELHHE